MGSDHLAVSGLGLTWGSKVPTPPVAQPGPRPQHRLADTKKPTAGPEIWIPAQASLLENRAALGPQIKELENQ